MRYETEIGRARELVVNWLRSRSFPAIHKSQLDEDGHYRAENGELAKQFFAQAKLRGFIWSLIESSEGYITRWSHQRFRPGKLPDPMPQFSAEDARLLACAALLEDPQCLAQLEDR